MAPKKTVLLLSLVLFVGLTSAAGLQFSEDSVWMNQDNTVKFNHTSTCTPQSAQVMYPGGATSGVQNTSDWDYSFSSFNGTGAYEFSVNCSSGWENGTVQAGNLSLSLENVPSDGEVEYGESFDASVVVDEQNDNLEVEPSELGLSMASGSDFSLEDGFNGASFTASAPSSGSAPDVYTLAVEGSYSGFDVSAPDDVELDTYSVEGFTTLVSDDSVNQRVKFRRMQDVSLDFSLLKRGSPMTDLSLDDFEFDGNSGSEWFDMDKQDDGNYRLYLKRTTSPEGSDYRELDYPVSVDSGSDEFDVGTLRMEREVEFSGQVLDINRGAVSTTFTAKFDEGGETTDSTGDNGGFQFYFSENKADRLDIDFPSGGFSLDEFNFVREGPSSTGSNVDDIRYNYYETPGENLDLSLEGVRPINLMSAKVAYGFKEDIDNTRGYMEYDSSRVDDYGAVEIYECSYWEFEAESCATEWEQIPENDVGFYSTSVPEFPVTPLSSDRFRGVENILSNAYLVGVPKGISSGLTLESSLDVSSTRVQSGDELTVSGTVISEETGEPVSGADLTLELVSEDNTVTLEEESGDDGGFEFSTEVDEAGEYTVEFSAEKTPYDSFQKESSSTINVYYQTGLTVSTENQVEISLGEASTIDFTLENTGQSEITGMDMEVSGIDQQYYTLTPSSLSSLDGSETVELRLDLPSDYCEEPCDPPAITLTVSGSSAGEQLENSASVYTRFPADDDQQDTQDSESPDNTSDSESSLGVPGPSEVSRMTGNFIESQSDMNLALGLILIFGLILAVTVRKRKEGDSDRENRMRGNGVSSSAAGAAGSSRVQRPDVSSSDTQPEEAEEQETQEETDEEVGEEESSEEEDPEDGEFVCDTCGEEFDTESGLNLHQNAFH